MPAAHLLYYCGEGQRTIAGFKTKGSGLYEFSDGLNCCLLHFRSPSLQKEQQLNKYRDAVGVAGLVGNPEWVVGALLDSLCIQTS
jgi:hypothetical protein